MITLDVLRGAPEVACFRLPMAGGRGCPSEWFEVSAEVRRDGAIRRTNTLCAPSFVASVPNKCVFSFHFTSTFASSPAL